MDKTLLEWELYYVSGDTIIMQDVRTGTQFVELTGTKMTDGKRIYSGVSYEYDEISYYIL